MNAPFFKSIHTQPDWHVLFAFQVFHLPPEDWVKMKWGFNAGALLEEALDRYKLFVESLSIHETEFLRGTAPNHALALRGIHSPESGLRMALLGKSCATDREQALENARQYARQVSSTFPHDFILVPAETEGEYENLAGEQLLGDISNVAQIQRGIVPMQKGYLPPYLPALWQASFRSNEQIWRALSAMPQPTLFNVLIKPSILSMQEKHSLQEMGKIASGQADELHSIRVPWIENYTKRRLANWKKFFLAQVHLITESGMEHLIRSVGSAITRDSNDFPLPGYQARYPEANESLSWRESIRLLELTENSARIEDLADTDEIFSIFRFPYRPEAGLPGANFNEIEKETDSSLG